MKAYRVKIGNKDLTGLENMELFFKTQKCAEKTMALIDSMLIKGKKIEWICDVVHIMDEKDVLKQAEYMFS